MLPMVLVVVQQLYLKQLTSDAQQKMKNNKINGKYWSSYVQWRNQLILTP